MVAEGGGAADLGELFFLAEQRRGNTTHSSLCVCVKVRERRERDHSILKIREFLGWVNLAVKKFALI